MRHASLTNVELAQVPLESHLHFEPASLPQRKRAMVAARIVREVSGLMRRAAEAGKGLATLSIDTEIRFRSAADRAAFSRELTEAVTRLASRYHDETALGGRLHRLVIVAHLLPGEHQRQRRRAMPVRKDESGRRSVQAEVEVPGTPGQVWEAIATGAGISSWFVPSEVDGRQGGKAVLHFGPGSSMDSVATITEWDAPRRFVATSQDEPGAPEVATEWIVEARSGGTCVVRVVHSWFASTDDWDGQFEGHEQGWAAFFRILRVYLEHFAGQPSAAFQVMGESNEPAPAAWQTLLGLLGMESPADGQRVSSSTSAPPLAGRVVRVGQAEYPELLLHLDAPAPGMLHLFAMPMGGRTYLPGRMYLFGDDAADVAAREEPRWQQLMKSVSAASQAG